MSLHWLTFARTAEVRSRATWAFTAAFETMRARNQVFSAALPARMDQRRTHRVEGEHDETATSKSFRCRLVQKIGTLQTERLKARAKLGNRMSPVSFAKRKMPATLVSAMDVQETPWFFRESGQEAASCVNARCCTFYLASCLCTRPIQSACSSAT